MQHLVGVGIRSATTKPRRERFFRDFLNCLKAFESTERGHYRLQRYCPNWMYSDGWTPESVIERLKREPIDANDYTIIGTWFSEWNGKRLSHRGRNNVNKRWAKKRHQD
jgi:hypothetical protein